MSSRWRAERGPLKLWPTAYPHLTRARAGGVDWARAQLGDDEELPLRGGVSGRQKENLRDLAQGAQMHLAC